MEEREVSSGGAEVFAGGMKFPGRTQEKNPNEDAANEIYMNKRITGIFLMLGMPTKIKGYRYLKEAVKMTVRDVKSTDRMRETVYGRIAEEYGEASARNVERACSYAVNIASDSGKMVNLNDLVGVTVYRNKHEKPSVGEFVSLIADRLRLELMK